MSDILSPRSQLLDPVSDLPGWHDWHFCVNSFTAMTLLFCDMKDIQPVKTFSDKFVDYYLFVGVLVQTRVTQEKKGA